MSQTEGSARAATELAAIVAEANEWANRLLEVLDDEREALLGGNTAGIDSTGQCKSECVNRLENLERERADLCRALDVADADVDEFLARHDTGINPENDWHQFLALLERCREANTVNGQVTQLRRRHVERALRILRGQAEDDAGLYGPNGLDHPDRASTLGLA